TELGPLLFAVASSGGCTRRHCSRYSWGTSNELGNESWLKSSVVSQMPATESNQSAQVHRFRRDLAFFLFATLFATYAYFWQSRDWNAASRLMLTYSLVDRHQIAIDGLEGQAGY